MFDSIKNVVVSVSKKIFKPKKSRGIFRSIQKDVSKYSSFLFNPQHKNNEKKLKSFFDDRIKSFTNKAKAAFGVFDKLFGDDDEPEKEETVNFEEVISLLTNTTKQIRLSMTVDFLDSKFVHGIEPKNDTKQCIIYKDSGIVGIGNTVEEAFVRGGTIAEMFNEEMYKVEISSISDEIDASKASTINTSPRNGAKIQYLVFHYTAGGNSKPGMALGTCNVFSSRPASADFIVDDGSMVQYNPDPEKFYCWAVGDKGIPNSTYGRTLRDKCFNRNSIHIEMCSTFTKGKGGSVNDANHDGWSFTDAVISRSIKLGKILMAKYNIPIENVCRHYDVTGKLCPGVPGWNLEAGSGSDAKWRWFKKMLVS